MTWIGPRVSVVMGEDFPALRLLAKKTKNGIPRIAILFQLAIVTVLLCTFTFEKVLVYIQFALTLCSFLTVLGVIVLRVKRPHLPRPYRTWGYPVTPLIFLAVSAWMMFYIVSDKPRESLAGLATMIAGLLVYFVSAKGQALTKPRWN
jgi:APA family basic amino acid/polyamine antiporter